MKPTAVPAAGPRLDVVTFGEVMGMLVAADTGPLADVTHYTRSLAGAELNVATGLVRLGHTAGWVGRVGDDPLGAHALAALRAEGVDTAQVTVDPEARTGFQLKSRVTAGDPEVVYFRKHSAGSRLAPSDAADAYVRTARHLHVTGIPAALSGTARAFTHRAMAAARDAGLTLSFDPNLRPALWPDRAEMVRTVNDLALRADWVLPGLSEGRLLTGAHDPADVAHWYLARGVRRVVLKDGARGATLYDSTGGCWTQPVFPVRAVDTVGAGDGFAAGLISAHLDGLGPQESLARAAAVGALATTSHGDRDGLPTRARLESFLRTRAAA